MDLSSSARGGMLPVAHSTGTIPHSPRQSLVDLFTAGVYDQGIGLRLWSEPT